MPPDQCRSLKTIKILFEPFELNVFERSLKKSGEAVLLGGRAFDLLVALVERCGETVGKNELIARVWPEVTVEEGGLRVHLSALRKALGDRQVGRSYIANVQGRGYRFVAPVTHQVPENEPCNTLARRSSLPARNIFARKARRPPWRRDREAPVPETGMPLFPVRPRDSNG